MKKPLNYIEKKLFVFYQRINSNTKVTTDCLSYYRILLGIYLVFSFRGYSWLIDVPPGFYRPNVLTLGNLFESLPPAWYFILSEVLLYLLYATIILGIKTRISFLLLFFLTIINNSFAYSFGKIDHDMISSLILLMFGFTNSGTKYALLPDKKIPFQNISLSVFALCIVFAFFTAGFEKALTWIDFDLTTSGFHSWLYSGYYTLNRRELLSEYFLQLPFWITEIMDYSAAIFEISGLVFLWHSRKSWFFYLFLASIFHLLNTLILNIGFSQHIVVYGLWLFLPLVQKNKWILLLFLLPLVFENSLMRAAFWIVAIGITAVNSQKFFGELKSRDVNN